MGNPTENFKSIKMVLPHAGSLSHPPADVFSWIARTRGYPDLCWSLQMTYTATLQEGLHATGAIRLPQLNWSATSSRLASDSSEVTHGVFLLFMFIPFGSSASHTSAGKPLSQRDLREGRLLPRVLLALGSEQEPCHQCRQLQSH